MQTAIQKHKREDCPLNDADIDALCNRFRQAFVLWDGAFSFASKVNPNRDDIALYCRFVKAAIRTHVEVGCSVTPKAHLMWVHVTCNMMLKGGL